jgi:excisionase family DNA binding protein
MMTLEIDGETFLTTNEACRAIGVSRETLNRYVNNGLIKRYKKGITRNAYYKQADVNELVRKRSELQEDEIEQ